MSQPRLRFPAEVAPESRTGEWLQLKDQPLEEPGEIPLERDETF